MLLKVPPVQCFAVILPGEHYRPHEADWGGDPWMIGFTKIITGINGRQVFEMETS